MFDQIMESTLNLLWGALITMAVLLGLFGVICVVVGLVMFLSPALNSTLAAITLVAGMFVLFHEVGNRFLQCTRDPKAKRS